MLRSRDRFNTSKCPLNSFGQCLSAEDESLLQQVVEQIYFVPIFHATLEEQMKYQCQITQCNRLSCCQEGKKRHVKFHGGQMRKSKRSLNKVVHKKSCGPPCCGKKIQSPEFWDDRTWLMQNYNPHVLSVSQFEKFCSQFS